jgi:hypothetical protein
MKTFVRGVQKISRFVNGLYHGQTDWNGWVDSSRTGKDTLPGAGPGSASGGSGKMSRPRGGVKREKAGIGYPLPESIIELMSKEVQRESFYCVTHLIEPIILCPHSLAFCLPLCYTVRVI